MTPPDPVADPAHYRCALDLTKRIVAKVDDTLAPLEREMKIMGWKPEYRRIVWETVARAALKKAGEA